MSFERCFGGFKSGNGNALGCFNGPVINFGDSLAFKQLARAPGCKQVRVTPTIEIFP